MNTFDSSLIVPFLSVAAFAAFTLAVCFISAYCNTARRQSSQAYSTLVYQIWNAQTQYLDLQEADCASATTGAVRAFEVQSHLLPLLTAAQEHRETARAWLPLNRLGSYAVLQQSELGLAALANFRHEAKALTRN